MHCVRNWRTGDEHDARQQNPAGRCRDHRPGPRNFPAGLREHRLVPLAASGPGPPQGAGSRRPPLTRAHLAARGRRRTALGPGLPADGSVPEPGLLSLAGFAIRQPGAAAVGRHAVRLTLRFGVLLLAGAFASAATPWAMAQSAPPPAFAPRVRPAPIAWSQLAPQQQQMLAPLQGQWNSLPPGQQQHFAKQAEKWASMPPQRQDRIRARLQRWADMTPEQRQQMRENARAFRNMSPAERAKVRAAFERFQALPPAQRKALREKWRSMNPEQRRQWLQSGAPEPRRPRGH